MMLQLVSFIIVLCKWWRELSYDNMIGMFVEVRIVSSCNYVRGQLLYSTHFVICQLHYSTHLMIHAGEQAQIRNRSWLVKPFDLLLLDVIILG